jgi:hypothetical protein
VGILFGLPTEMGKSFVRFGHSVGIFFFLNACTSMVMAIGQLI